MSSHASTHIPDRRAPSRREFLCRSANGFGGLALAAMTAEKAAAADRSTDPLMPRTPHFEAQAKAVIFLYMDGGPLAA